MSKMRGSGKGSMTLKVMEVKSVYKAGDGTCLKTLLQSFPSNCLIKKCFLPQIMAVKSQEKLHLSKSEA